MDGTLTPADALAELIDVSTSIRRAALLDADGGVEAEIGGTGLDASALWQAADDAARLLGRPAVQQCEIGLGDALVFAVREGARSAVAVTDADATAGLVFYDLRHALRSSGPSDA